MRRRRIALAQVNTAVGAIEACVEGHQAAADIVARGFDAPTVEQVIAMVDRNEYKRRQGPVGIKITPRAFG